MVHLASTVSVRTIGMLLSAALIAAAQPVTDALQPRWSKAFNSDFSVINATVTSEYGLRWHDRGMPSDLATVHAVDTAQAPLLILEGRPDRDATLHAIDPHTGNTRWEKRDVRLSRWRPFPSYVVARQSFPAYFAQVVGSIVLLAVANGADGPIGCSPRPEVVALDVADGRLLWCSSDIPGGDVTYVPVPERNTLLAWSAADEQVVLFAVDLRTGATRWRHPLDVNGADWIRAITFMTALTGDDSTRPPLHHSGRVLVMIGEARRVGPVVRPPDRLDIRSIDIDSGKASWQAALDVPGRRTFLSWTFSDRYVIVTTGEHLNAYDLLQGTKVWSAPLKDVRSLRVAAGGRREVVLVDFDARNWLLAPTRTGRGLAAVDAGNGEILWRDDAARVLQPLDRVGASVFVEAGQSVRAIAVETGSTAWSVRPPFEQQVRLARQLAPDTTLLQSAGELALFRAGSPAPARTIAIPRARRGLPKILITTAINVVFNTLPFAITVATATAMAPSSFEMRNRQLPAAADHAFFATGAGSQSRIVAVDLQTGAQQTVAPFIWGGMGEFRLGNLIDDRHGLVYTVEKRTLAAYEFAIDGARHQRVHQLSELEHALELNERAAALRGGASLELALREARRATEMLEAASRHADVDSTERLAIYKGLGDVHALLAEAAADNDRLDARRRAIAAYEVAMGTLEGMARESPSTALESLRAELERRREQLRQR